jgi:hypothetical protein
MGGGGEDGEMEKEKKRLRRLKYFFQNQLESVTLRSLTLSTEGFLSDIQ